MKDSKRRNLTFAVLILLAWSVEACSSSAETPTKPASATTASAPSATTLRPQPGAKWTEDQIAKAAAPMRAGRKLTPPRWPGDARVAVCLSFDVDTESFTLAAGNTLPVTLSEGAFGAHEGLPRIVDLLARHHVPGSFFVPAVSAINHPEIVKQILSNPRNEIGIHGYIHESVVDLNDAAEEERLLNQAIEFWTKALGKRPRGYRAPAWAFSPYTLDLIRKAGFEYDSSAMAMDEPYEIMSNGQDTNMVELPVEWIQDDFPYYTKAGTLPSPELIYTVYKDEFDGAYRDGTMFMLTNHPQVSGHRSRIKYLDQLIGYMKSKPGVWFATAGEIADYVKNNSAQTKTH